MKYFIGVDPGNKGAICLLDPDEGTVQFLPTPILKSLTPSVRHIFRGLPPADWIKALAIEDVHSVHNSSAKSNFQFGRSLGAIESIVAYWFMDYEYIAPKAWQKICGITFTYPKGATSAQKSSIRKKTTAAKALELYPDVDLYGPRGGLLDGRADSLMIAHALWCKYETSQKS